ncbi:MAG: sensor histidine kinase [Sphingomonas sp.]|nr:sensor histidine kinase [Sphingomonas sp.]
MLALSAVATVVALVLAGWALTGVLERFVMQGLDRRLDAEVALLASAVDADGRIDRTRLEQRLGAFDNGPGWRWRIAAPGQTVGSADFPVLDDGPPAPPPPPGGANRLHPLDGGSEDGVRVHARQLTIATRRGPVVLTAAAPRDVVRQPIREAIAPLLGALAVLAALLGLATLLQLRLGLRPLRLMRDQVAAIRSGARSRIDEDQPTELQPLAMELNALARDNAAALAAARQSAANLAHALKTPVATLALDVRDEPARAAQVARIDATIRHHLARARVEAVNRRTSTPLAPAVADLAVAVGRIHGTKGLSIETDVAGDIAVQVDPRDLDELIGNLLDNAARHAQRRVIVTARRDTAEVRQVRLEIADDGPGIPPDEWSRVTLPGTRLDERSDGHGFGLSIAAELAGLYGGSLNFDVSPMGGLLVRMRLPST